MRYEVTHTTRYRYEAPVSQCLNEVRLTPRTLPYQRVFAADIRVQPEPTFFDRRKDYFGNDVTAFSVFEKHDSLTITAVSVVEVQPQAPRPPSQIPWEQARDLLGSYGGGPLPGAFEFIFGSPFVPAGAELGEFARPVFEPGRPLAEAAAELSHRIHSEFLYQPESTSIEMPLTEVLRKRQGVCQDFAHIMIGALRSQRLAARYVSGYLRNGDGVQGAQASHAWVSVFVPGDGWLNFDPTNDVIPADGHITLAWGRDYGDVTPVKGITLGGGGQTVDVEVFVKATEPLAVTAGNSSG